MNPKVSIIISTHNQAKYLEQAVSSVMNQSYDNIHAVLIDDQSTDTTPEVIERLLVLYPELEVEYDNDVGSSNTRDRGVWLALSDYIVFLDGDDWIDKAFVEKTMSIMLQDRNLGFVYVDTTYVKDGIHSPVPSPEYNFYNLIQNNFISYCSLFNREAYIDCGGYDLHNFGYFEDYQLYLNLGRHGWYGKHLGENLFYYRIHSESSFQSIRAQTLFPLYRAYLISQYPEIHPPQWTEQAKIELKKYPNDFMSWKPKDQEKYVHNVSGIT